MTNYEYFVLEIEIVLFNLHLRHWQTNYRIHTHAIFSVVLKVPT